MKNQEEKLYHYLISYIATDGNIGTIEYKTSKKITSSLLFDIRKEIFECLGFTGKISFSNFLILSFSLFEED